MATFLAYHKDYEKHRQPPNHPERPERLTETIEYFKKTGLLNQLEILTPKKCAEKDLLRVHTREHVKSVLEASRKETSFDEDTHACKKTYDTALLAAGGLITAGKKVMENKGNAFALVRPPGHHATRDRAMGFCYFNNPAVLIRHLQEAYGLNRVFLLDWDAHAFNGTCEVFYCDPSVLDVSIHQDPRTLYPHTGFINEMGAGVGEGYTVNIPVPAGTGNADYAYILEEFVLPLAEMYKPEFVVVSAGQDSHRDDPLSGLCLTEEGYGFMTDAMLKLACKACDGRILFELEGGYNLESLKKSNHTIVSTLLGNKSMDAPPEGLVRESTLSVVTSLKRLFSPYWRT